MRRVIVLLCPKVLFSPDPQYVELTVNADGSAGNIQILQPLGFGLDEKAVESVRQWEFKPANMDGHPVSAGIQVEIEFRAY